MSTVLVLYHSYDEQTSRIAHRMGDVLRDTGHSVAVTGFHGQELPDLEAFDAVVVGAAVRYGAHDHRLRDAIKHAVARLKGRPSGFFSVCLAAGGPGAKPEVAKGYLEDFLEYTEWEPAEFASFAGALQYSRYGFFRRLMMRMITGYAGGPTDTSRDYEYTDWAAVERFARSMGRRLPPSTMPAAA